MLLDRGSKWTDFRDKRAVVLDRYLVLKKQSLQQRCFIIVLTTIKYIKGVEKNI